MNWEAKCYSEILDKANYNACKLFKKWIYPADLHSSNSYFNLYLNIETFHIFKRLNPKANYTYIETSEIESCKHIYLNLKCF